MTINVDTFVVSIAVLSLVVSYIAYRKASRLQSYEFETRLQIVNEKKEELNQIQLTPLMARDSITDEFAMITHDHQSTTAFIGEVDSKAVVVKYGTDILNKGNHPVLIKEILGSCKAIGGTHGKVLLTDVYILPNERARISFEFYAWEVMELLERSGAKDYHWELVVKYQSAENRPVIVKRNLGGPHMVSFAGPALLPPPSRSHRAKSFVRVRYYKFRRWYSAKL